MLEWLHTNCMTWGTLIDFSELGFALVSWEQIYVTGFWSSFDDCLGSDLPHEALSEDIKEQSSMVKVASDRTLTLPMVLGHWDRILICFAWTHTHKRSRVNPFLIPRFSFLLLSLNCGIDKLGTLALSRSAVPFPVPMQSPQPGWNALSDSCSLEVLLLLPKRGL